MGAICPAPYRARGAIYKEKGDAAKAIRDLDVAIKRDPRPAEPYFDRAQLRKARGETEQALADLNDRRAFRPLVDALSIQDDRSATAALASALQRLTGVSRWRGKDAAWWIDWWSHNCESFDTPTPTAKEEER